MIVLRVLWCNFWHRDSWLGYGEGDTWFLKCPRCREQWAEFRTGANAGRRVERAALSDQPRPTEEKA